MHGLLKNIDAIPVFNDLTKLYGFLGLPVEHIGAGSQIAIHRLGAGYGGLGDAGMPFRSPVFRCGFYSLVFVKNDFEGSGAASAMVHFIPPGHCKSFEWGNIREAWLLMLSECFLRENVHADAFDAFPFLQGGVSPMPLSKPDMVGVLDHLYGQIFEEYFSGSAYRNKIIGNLLMVLLLKTKECLPDGMHAIERDRQSEIVSTFKRGLENHYRDLLNGTGQKVFRQKDYAIAQNLHPNYLNSVVKSKTGKSVGAWITDKTILEAKSLLQNSSVSVKEIAYRLGFAEPSHFSNYFKKHTRLSPVFYRRQAGQPDI